MNLTILDKYVDRGLVVKQDHTTLPLSIYNYSRTCQYDKLWDDVTLQCRGLIVDSKNNKIIVRPFKKFFNYEELIGDKMDHSSIPTQGDYVYIQEKMDGSLGILFNYEGEWVMATRGSFTSEQATKGLEIIKSKYNLDSWLKEYAYLVEIIYPENRIVVDYGKEKVVFLSIVLNEGFSCWKPTDESELHWTTACSIFVANGIKKTDIVKTEQYFNFSDELYNKLKSENEDNKEGYVLRYQPGNFRMKIKFEEYVRLHRILTNFSTTDIWELLKNGGNMNEFLERVPDEFDTWVRETVKDLVVRYENIEKDYFEIFSNLKSQNLDRKEFAVKAIHYRHSSVLFSMLDGKNYSDIIWKIIKPKWSKPFRKDTDN